jgi:hypothetical protein
MCNQLEKHGDDEEEEEEEEQGLVRIMCIKPFLLLLVGLTMFANKNNINVHLIWLTALQNLDTMDEWSWGGLALAFLYSQLSLTSDPRISVIGGYMTLFEVILFIFSIAYQK